MGIKKKLSILNSKNRTLILILFGWAVVITLGLPFAGLLAGFFLIVRGWCGYCGYGVL